MKLLIAGLTAAAMLAAAPAWADGGHGSWKRGKQWHKYQVREHDVVREYRRPVPVYPGPVYYPVYPAPAPGIHIVMPDVYIPFR